MIPAAPPKPERTDSVNFPAKADAFVTWMADSLVPAFNADIAAMNTNDTRDTSTSSVLIGSGTKVFTVSAGKSFSAGQWLTISNTPAPTNQMIGNVTSYSGTTLTVTVPANGVFGSGTLAVWTIALTAAPSAAVSAAMAPVTAGATLAAARTAMDVPSNAEVMHSGYMQIQDQKASGTSGGASTATAMTRTLNTVVSNTISGASLASNVITLPAGTYRVRAESMAVADTTASHITPYLQNTADSVKALTGLRSYTGVGMSANPSVNGRFTIAATKTFTLVNQYSAGNANGLGLQASFGYVEVYSNVEIWKE